MFPFMVIIMPEGFKRRSAYKGGHSPSFTMPKRAREETTAAPTDTVKVVVKKVKTVAIPTRPYALALVSDDDEIDDFQFNATEFGETLLSRLLQLKVAIRKMFYPYSEADKKIQAEYQDYIYLLLSLCPDYPCNYRNEGIQARNKYFPELHSRTALGKLTLVGDPSDIVNPVRSYRFHA